MTLQDNINKNKGKALYYAGIILAAMFKQLFETLSKYLPADTWWGDGLAVIFGYVIIAISIIAPLLFGNDPEITRVKSERKEIGQGKNQTDIENEGLRVTNKLQAQLLAENDLKPYEYQYEKIEKKTDSPEPDL